MPNNSSCIYTCYKDLAYVIYTSGTTGKPKGVMIEHRNIVNLVLAIKEILEVSHKDSFLFYRSYVFDGVIEETILPLISGARVNICTSGIKDLAVFFKTIKENHVSIININSESMQVLGDSFSEDLGIKKVIAGGTKFNTDSFSSLLKRNITVYNSYGPTECTVDSTYFQIDSKKNSWIGKPIYNTKVYILDESMGLRPVGAVGELYVGGDGVARGYLNLPELTKEKFVTNPFQTELERNDISYGEEGRNARLYKTGDIVRWLPDGNIEYIGRKDFQIKLRGYRIELGEIESILSGYPEIKQSIVEVKERMLSDAVKSGDKYLVGYYVSNNVIEEDNLFTYLKGKLPEYMIPRTLVRLSEFPLTVNGKVDRKSLPEPSFTASKYYTEPRNNVEAQLIKIWCEVLGFMEGTIGIKDDFFRLGGDSIVSIQIISRLRQRLNLSVSVKDIFAYKTIEKLYDNVISRVKKDLREEIKSEQGTLKGAVALLPIQQWFFASEFKVQNYWNQSFIIKTPKLEIECLENSVAKLMNYHDAFRLRYRKDKKGVYRQFYAEVLNENRIRVLDINVIRGEKATEPLSEILSDWQSEFNIEKGPMYVMGYLHGYEDGSSRIFVAMHHLIVDTVSWRIIKEDLQNIYNGKELGLKTSSYRQWAEVIENYGILNQKEKLYWDNVLLDYRKENIEDKLGSSIYQEASKASFSLSKELTRWLLHESNRAYNTQINDILLTALCYTLNELTGDDVHHVVLEGHGREEIDRNIDITNTIGWFTTMYPIRIALREDIGESIKYIKETLRQVPNNGIGYGSLVGYKETILPKISFNYLGQFDRAANSDPNTTPWQISKEDAGRWMHPSNKGKDIINITGLIIDECLKFRIVNNLSKDVTNKISTCFKSKIENIINHTIKINRSYLTTSDIQNVISQEYLDKIQMEKEIQQVYKVHGLKQGFIYHNLKQGDIDEAYRAQLVWKYEQKINPDNLKKAWTFAQKKYSSLRLRFAWDQELIQIIDKEGELNWKYFDLTKEQNSKIKIEKIQKEDGETPYNLADGGLFRLNLIKQSEDLYICVFNSHHSILDGWSNPILIGYVHDVYLKLQNKEFVLLDSDESYGEAQKYLQDNIKKNENFWGEYIANIEKRDYLNTLLKPERQNIKFNDYRYVEKSSARSFEISNKFFQNLKEFTQNEGVTPNAVLQYIWHKTLSIYTNAKQTIVGTTLSGRNIPVNNVEDSVGLYINTVPLILRHQNEKNNNRSVLSAIREVQYNINDINDKSNVDLANLQKGERFFNCLFVYDNYPKLVNKGINESLKITFIGSVEKVDYPLAIIVYEKEMQLTFELKYAGELFDDDVIEKLLKTCRILLDQIVVNPAQKEGELVYLTKEDNNLIIKEWNKTDHQFTNNKTISELFTEQANRYPSNIAVIEGASGNKYDYKTLLNESNLFAKYILKYKIDNNNAFNFPNNGLDNSDGKLIAVLSEKGYNQVLSILAVIRSKHSYLPLNLEIPIGRIDEILKNSKTKILLVSKNSYQHIEGIEKLSCKYKLLVIEDILLEIRQKKPSAEYLTNKIKLPHLSQDDIAYVIFTSGSTGKPKGVTINHKGAINTINSVNDKFHITPKDKIFAISELSFDLSVYDIFGMLFAAGTVIFPDQRKIKDPSHWLNLIQKYKITIWNSAPQLADLLANEMQIKNAQTKLRLFLLSGDWIPLTLPVKLKNLHPDGRIISLGGATEASIWSIWHEITEVNNAWQSIPYGTPMPNQQMYILNYYDKVCSTDMIGEIHIGGVGLALNYWQDIEKTNKSFIDHETLGRLYRTGDIGKWDKKGYLRILGRKDNQVKINGFRIELGEIENVLSSYEDIQQCVVIAKEHTDSASNNKYLAAYYTTASGDVLEESTLLSYLSSHLPDYMVPSAFIWLEKFPLTINGKLDRKALPEVKFGGDKDAYIAPRNGLESEVCSIFAEVLGLDPSTISIRDDFFRMGGDSILAIRLVSKIIKNTDLAVNVAAIFAHKNIENLLRHLENNNKKEVTIEQCSVKNEKEQLLSFAQERLWFIEKYERGTNAYNVPIIIKINKKANIELLKQSIEAVVERHEILRTLIKEDERGNGYQAVSDNLGSYIEEIDASNKNELNAYFTQDEDYVFNLANEWPIRIKIYHLPSDQSTYLCIVIHHIAFDGWSTDILLDEIEKYYQYYNDKSSNPSAYLHLSPLPIQYKDFALWQRSYLTGEILHAQLSYWKNKLEGYKTLALATDYTRPIEIDYKGKKLYFQIEKNLSFALREVAKSLGVSLYSLLLASYYLMLRAYTGQNDIVVGTPVANRHSTQIQHLIGFFVNTLALRINIDTTSKIVDFIKNIGHEVTEAQLYQDLPFERLVDELKVPKDTSRHPIFQIMFGVQGFGTREVSKKDRANKYILDPYESREEASSAVRFDIETFIDDSGEILKGSFSYRENLYKEETIKGFVDTYLTILGQIQESLRNPKLTIQELAYLVQEPRNLLLHTYNNTDFSYQDCKAIHQIFENQVTKTPDNIALVYGDIKLTYDELNKRSSRLAHYLITNHNIETDIPVVMYLDRSEDAIISILAILKAGGTYVPLDIDSPSDRVKYILDDTNAKLIITTKKSAMTVKKNISSDINILFIDSRKISKALSNQPNTNPPALTTWNNLAYIIYTSGTTGKPKGVMVEQRAVSSLVKDVNYIKANGSDTSMQLSNLAFDAATFEIWISLLNGGKLFIPTNTSELLSNTLLFQQVISANNITTLWLTKTLFDQLFLLNNELFYKIKYLLVGGEALNPKLMKAIINSQHSPQNIINGYGPTENTTFSCTLNITRDNIKNINTIPIGTPLTNRKTYILAPDSKALSPVGAVGELCVGGVGLARGYLNQPDLTAECFIDNPFQTEEEVADKSYGQNGRNARLYRTGDLARWLPDGNLEYIGRTDFQVKIRGFRIELGEIENVLSSYEDIQQCVVIAKEHTDSASNNKYLAAYYTTASGDVLEESTLLSYLSSHLPDYMVPSAFIWLEKFPLTINGKLDRKALPEVKFGGDKDAYIAPRNGLESEVCSIFAEVLGLDPSTISIRDDFFRMGGDSIVSMQLVSRLRQRLDLWYVNVKDVFVHKTVEKIYDNVISKNLESSDNNASSIITEHGALSGDVPLLPIQQWFFDNNFSKPNHWNQSFLVKVPYTLDVEQLRGALQTLLEHHDAFRLRYNSNNIQYYDDKAKANPLNLLDVSNFASEDEIDAVLKSWQNDFDLEKGPLCSIGYLHGFKDNTSRVFFALHHLIVDTVSWRILVEDLERTYKGNLIGLKGSSYRQWVQEIKNYNNSNKDEIAYWYNVTSDLEKSNKALEAFATLFKSHTTLSFDKELTSKLLKDSSKAYNTEINDILLSTLSLTLSEILGNTVNHITLEGHGREEISQSLDITRTVGWFTTMYPVRLTTYNNNGDENVLGDTIKYTKELLRQIPNKGIGYGPLVGYKDNTLPKISFNYLGQLDQGKDDQQKWQIVSDTSGTSMNPENHYYNLININGFVSQGSLNFDIMTKLDIQNTEFFARIFQKNLYNVITHCVSCSVSQYTPSDFRDFNPCVYFNSSTHISYQNRLFIFPPGEGGAESYFNNIVPKLEDINLVIFNNYYHFLKEVEKKTSEKYITYQWLANYYTYYIKSIQPTGPYNLLGWSFGSIVALEVTKQLISMGDRVENIFMIDPLLNLENISRKINPGLEYMFDRINYEYFPDYSNIKDLKIHLFKATKLMDSTNCSGDLYKVFKYYVGETKYNHLELFLDEKLIDVKKLSADHYNWINDQESIATVCTTVLNSLASSADARGFLPNGVVSENGI